MTGGWRIAARNLARNRRRNVATGLAVALGYAAVLLLGGYARRVEGLMRTGTVYVQHLGHLSIHRPGGMVRAAAKPSAYSFPAADQRAIAAILGADPRVELAGRSLALGGLAGNGCKSVPFAALGVELDVERRILSHPEVRRWTPELARPLAGVPLPDASGVDGAVALSGGLANSLGKRPAPPGDPVRPAGALECGTPAATAAIGADPVVQLAGFDFDGGLSAVDARVVAVYRAPTFEEDKSSITTSLDTLQRLAGTDAVTSISVYLRDARDVSAVARDLGARLAAAGIAAEIHRFDDLDANPFYVGTMDFVAALVGFIGILVAAVATLSVLNAMTLTVLERTRELATFRSLGFTRRQVTGLFLREATALTAIGVAAGLAIGLAAAGLVNAAGIRFTPPGMAGTIRLLILPGPALCAGTAALYFPLSLAATWIAVRRRIARSVASLLTAVAA
jgi:putative ABC transport system permease protein